MRGTSPAPDPETLARWLLVSDGGAHMTPEEITVTAIRVYDGLRVHLALFLGLQGFDALWARALHLVRRTFPWAATDALVFTPAAHQLDVLVRGRDAADVHAVLLAVFTEFLTLLFTFIGDGLGFRLLQQRWPALPAPSASAPTEEAQL